MGTDVKKKKVYHVRRCPIFLPKSGEEQKKLITSAGKVFQTTSSSLKCASGSLSDLVRHLCPTTLNLKLLKSEDLCNFELAKLMHQYKTKNLPQPLAKLFISRSDIHNYRTGNSAKSNYYTPPFNTSRTQHSFKYQGVKVWNTIPPNTKSKSFNSF